MAFERTKRAHLVGWMATLFGASAALLVLVLPGSREAIDYLIVGTFATAVLLVATFVWFVKTQGSSATHRQ